MKIKMGEEIGRQVLQALQGPVLRYDPPSHVLNAPIKRGHNKRQTQKAVVN